MDENVIPIVEELQRRLPLANGSGHEGQNDSEEGESTKGTGLTRFCLI